MHFRPLRLSSFPLPGSPASAPLCSSLNPSSLLASPSRTRTRLSAHRLNILYVQKQASVPKCGDCGDKLRGIKALRPAKLKGTITSKRQKHVTRAYGGARCVPTIRRHVRRDHHIFSP